MFRHVIPIGRVLEIPIDLDYSWFLCRATLVAASTGRLFGVKILEKSGGGSRSRGGALGDIFIRSMIFVQAPGGQKLLRTP